MCRPGPWSSRSLGEDRSGGGSSAASRGVPGPESRVGRYGGEDHSCPVAPTVGRASPLGHGRAGRRGPHRGARAPAAAADGGDRGRRLPRPAGGAPDRPGPVRHGGGRALVVSVAGVALVRLSLQLVPDAVARWLLAPVGVVLFLWFVPLWLARDGRGLGLALLAGLAADTALAGLFGSWDYAWSIDGWTAALAVVLAGAAGWALVVAGARGPERPEEPAGRAGLAAVLPLA